MSFSENNKFGGKAETIGPNVFDTPLFSEPFEKELNNSKQDVILKTPQFNKTGPSHINEDVSENKANQECEKIKKIVTELVKNGEKLSEFKCPPQITLEMLKTAYGTKEGDESSFVDNADIYWESFCRAYYCDNPYGLYYDTEDPNADEYLPQLYKTAEGKYIFYVGKNKSI